MRFLGPRKVLPRGGPEERGASYQMRQRAACDFFRSIFPVETDCDGHPPTGQTRTRPSPEPRRAWHARRRRFGSSPKISRISSSSSRGGSSRSAPSSTSIRQVPQLALRHENGTGAFFSSQRSTRAVPAGASTSTEGASVDSNSTWIMSEGRYLALFERDRML